MKVLTERIKLQTRGDPDLIDLTPQIKTILSQSKLSSGSMTVFVVGSTAAITTFEYEPGLARDVAELFDRLIPRDKRYHPDDTWQDANGFSHLRASVQGPSLVVPFADGELLLGTWQQVVLAEFDNRPRKRDVVVQLIGA
jgi:secondary thiamine-phosphate synthase enzyme